MVGTTLQQYRVLRALGTGGMGEVYAAEDTRLHRLVALKLLPADMATDVERLQRFEREAQAVAALNHPNVVTLYGVEEAGGVRFLAMELVEGRTLAELTPGDGFPLSGFLDLAIQLTDAIGAAHQRGIVHRDLKPANVMVTPDGRVKVLDFGLAKLRRDGIPVGDGETRTAADLTTRHHVIGTAAYMSPEQAEGRPIDARSDIFSLGVVLYQMATGERPFRGDTALSVISSILKDTPQPPSRVNSRIPPQLDRIIRRCLAKEPAQRYQSALDIRHDLIDLRSRIRGLDDSRLSPLRRRRGYLAAGAGLILIALAAVFWHKHASAVVPGPPTHLEFTRLTTDAGIEWFPSLSPDGRWIVYAADGAAARHIYLQSVTGRTRLDLTKDSIWDEDQPVFSPDGERIAFRSAREGGGIFVMGRTGEAQTRVTHAGYNPAWSPDGTRLVYSMESMELNPQNSAARAEIWVATVATGETHLLSPSDGTMPAWSPHDHRIAFASRFKDRLQGTLWTMAVDGSQPVQLPAGPGRDWDPRWSPDGRFLYFVSDRSGTMNLWRVPIDERTGKSLGPAQPLTTPATMLAHPAISGDGSRIVYTSAQITSNVQSVALDPNTGVASGEPSWLTSGSQRWANPDPSPDGEWVAFYSLAEPEGHIQIARADGTGEIRQVTGDAGIDRMPKWSSDGKWIAFFSTRSRRYQIWRVRPDASDLQQVTREGGSYFAWSPDASRMAVFQNIDRSTGGNVMIFDVNEPANQQKVERLPQFGNPRWEFWVNSWSPDGARLAAHIGPGIGRGIGVYTLATKKYEKMTDFGEWPVWLPDARRLLFVSGGKTFYTVDTLTKEIRKIFLVGNRDVVGPPRLTRDGRRAYFIRRMTESDVWMVTIH